MGLKVTFRSLLSLRGRIDAAEFTQLSFGISSLGALVFGAAFLLLGALLNGPEIEPLVLPIALAVAAAVISLPVMFIHAAAIVRRLHDLNLTGWWSAPLWAAAVGIWVAVLTPESLVAAIVAIALGPMVAAAMITLLAKRGSPGANRFGRARALALPARPVAPPPEPPPKSRNQAIEEGLRIARAELDQAKATLTPPRA